MRQRDGSAGAPAVSRRPEAGSVSGSCRRLHPALVALLAAHVPVLVLAGVSAGVAVVLAPLAAVGAGVGGARFTGRAVAASGGLAVASVMLLWVSGEGAVGHLHVALVLALVPAYGHWRPVLCAAGVAGAGYAVWIGGLIAAGAAPAAVLVPPALVAAVGAASAMCWRAAARAEERVRELSNEVRRQEAALAQRVEDVETLKARLIESVSHEFRTPLTSLTGYARTLAAKMDRMPPAAVDRCVSGIDEHATRLARLVHNVLAAGGDIATDPLAITDVSVVARRAADQALESHGARVAVALDVPETLHARVDLLLARQIVGNLVDNAVRYAPEGSLVRVTGTLDGSAVALTVTNKACGLEAASLDRLFEPFGALGAGAPGEGLHLGLHAARRAALASGGDLTARLADGWLSMRLALPAAVAVAATPDAV